MPEKKSWMRKITYALLIIWRSPKHWGLFSHLLSSDQVPTVLHTLQPRPVWFVYYFLNRIYCPRLLLVSLAQVTALIPLPTYSSSERNLRQWCHTLSMHLKSFSFLILTYLERPYNKLCSNSGVTLVQLYPRERACTSLKFTH